MPGQAILSWKGYSVTVFLMDRQYQQKHMRVNHLILLQIGIWLHMSFWVEITNLLQSAGIMYLVASICLSLH